MISRMHTTRAHAAIAGLCLAAAVMAQVKTDKSNLWKKLEAGEHCVVKVMGSSMSQTSKSSWPGELESQINALVTGNVSIEEAGTANGQTSATGRFDRLGGVLDAAPEAVIMEYAFTDSRGSKGVSLEEHVVNMTAMVTELRHKVPGIEIFIYETGRVSYTTEENTPMLLDYYAATKQVAADMSTYLFQTANKFTIVRERLIADGQKDMWVEYVYDSHHPTQKAAVEIIVPEMLSVMRGLGSAPLEPTVALSMQSLTGRSVYVADTMQLQWYYDPARISAVDVQLSVDGGQSYHSILSAPIAASSYLWAPPAVIGGTSAVTEQAQIKVRAVDGDHEDVSGVFTILPATDKPALTLNALAHDVYRVGETLSISWEKDPNRVEGVEVSLSLDGGRDWHPLNGDAVNVTAFSWPIGATIEGEGILTDQAIVKIKAYSGTAESLSERFAIHGAPYVIDDQDDGVAIIGDWSIEGKYPNGYNGTYLDDDREGRGQKSVTYSFTPPAAGTYAVYAWTPYAGTGVPDEAPAIITASDGSHSVGIRIKKVSEWQLLGKYPGQAGSPITVMITNDVSVGGTIIADAVKFEMTAGDASTGVSSGMTKITTKPLSMRLRAHTLTVAAADAIHSIQVFDAAGRQALCSGGAARASVCVDISSLAAGTYVARIVHGMAIGQKRFILRE